MPLTLKLGKKSSRRIFIMLLSVFLGLAFIGYVFAVGNPDAAVNITQKIGEEIGPVSDSDFKNFVMIFTNNSMVAAFMVLSGLLFGLGPWFIMAFNGFIVGVVVRAVQLTGNISATQILLGLIPHGIVEIPALAIAGTAGIMWYQEIVHGEGEIGGRFKIGALRALKLFGISVLLLIVAAFIEAYVTPSIAGIG